MLFGPRPWILRNSSAVGGNFSSSSSRRSQEPRSHDSCSTAARPFADAGDVGDFALGIAQDIGDALGIAFDGGGAVAIAADAEAVFAGDLHQVGGFARAAARFHDFPSDLVADSGAKQVRLHVNENVGNPVQAILQADASRLRGDLVRVHDGQVGVHFQVQIDVVLQAGLAGETFFDAQRAGHRQRPTRTDRPSAGSGMVSMSCSAVSRTTRNPMKMTISPIRNPP